VCRAECSLGAHSDKGVQCALSSWAIPMEAALITLLPWAVTAAHCLLLSCNLNKVCISISNQQNSSSSKHGGLYSSLSAQIKIAISHPILLFQLIAVSSKVLCFLF